MKAALVALLLALAAWVWPSDALILIGPDDARPIVDENSYIQGEWLLWPPEESAGSNNRLLSLLTGIDWSSKGNELLFKVSEDRYLSVGYADLQKRGYFVARDRVVQVPTSALSYRGSVSSPTAAFLAMSGKSPQVKPLGFDEAWPAGLIVAQADSWDRVAAIVRKCGGRAIVVEYPPVEHRRWSRYWLRGSGWSDRLPIWRDWGVPGLIPASQAGNLLQHPTTFPWTPNDTANWGGANRWLGFIAYASPLALSILGFLTAFFVGCAVYLISREERAPLAAVSLKYLTLVPASVLLAGSLTRASGLSFALIWLAACFAMLTVLSQLAGGLLKKIAPGAHPMLGICLVGLVASAISSPLWSMYSNVLGANTLPLSPESAGSLFGYLVGVVAFSRSSGWAHWGGRGIAIAIFLWGQLANPWWVAGQWPFALLPLVALAVGERLYRIWLLPLFAALPLADGKVFEHGIVWAPGNLYPDFAHSGGVNLARHVEFFVSHGFLGSLALAGIMALFVERFFFHEIRRTLIRDSRIKALFQASFLCAAMGLFQPLMLYGALICFVGGTFVLLADTARAV